MIKGLVRLHEVRPVTDGLYMVGNHNKYMSRLEVELVRLDNGDVTIIDCGTSGYKTTDWDFWSHKMEEGV